jgi:hypothetical protein
MRGPIRPELAWFDRTDLNFQWLNFLSQRPAEPLNCQLRCVIAEEAGPSAATADPCARMIGSTERVTFTSPEVCVDLTFETPSR